MSSDLMWYSGILTKVVTYLDLRQRDGDIVSYQFDGVVMDGYLLVISDKERRPHPIVVRLWRIDNSPHERGFEMLGVRGTIDNSLKVTVDYPAIFRALDVNLGIQSVDY